MDENEEENAKERISPAPLNEINIFDSIRDEYGEKNLRIDELHENDEMPPDLFTVDDEFNVEDAIEEDDYETQNITDDEDNPIVDELNWDDFEVVDEVDSGENASKIDEENYKFDSNHCELQQISDDEQDEPSSLSRAVSIITSTEDNILSCQNSLSPSNDAPMVNVMIADGKKTAADQEEIDEKTNDDRHSMEIAAADTSSNLNLHATNEGDTQKPTSFTSENECQIIAAAESEPVKPTTSTSKSYIEIDGDVLEITVRGGEDLEMNDVDHFSHYTELKKDFKNEIKHELNQNSNEKPSSDDVQQVADGSNEDNSTDVGSTKRTVPLPDVALFVESLAQLTFDWKKYTCFYCNPCQFFVTSTSAWEDHVSNSNHKKNNFRWKACHDMLQKETLDCTSKHQSELLDRAEEKSSDFVAGPEFVIEICGDTGQPRQWFCQLCNSVVNSFDFLLSHLNSFGHVDNFMEKMDPDLYTPPGRCSHEKLSDNVRVVTESIEKRIMEEAKKFVRRKGIGRMKSYKGETYRDSWGEVDENQIEMEEQVLAQEVQRFFNEDQNYGVKCDMKSPMLSVANAEYRKMDPKTKNLFIGLQYLLEIWTPSRRVIPVWYCILCDSLVTNWSKHCEVVQHIAAYLNKHYKKPAFDPAVLEANDEEELRNNFILAKKKVLQLEEYSGRVNWVVQITKLAEFDSFVAINAIIAKQIVDRYKIRVGDPPRPKRILTSKEDRYRVFDSNRKTFNSSSRPVNASGQKSLPAPSAKRSPKSIATASYKRPSENNTTYTNGSPKKTYAAAQTPKTTKLPVTVIQSKRTLNPVETQHRETDLSSKRTRTPTKLSPKKRKSLSPIDRKNQNESKPFQQQKPPAAGQTSSVTLKQPPVKNLQTIRPTAKSTEKSTFSSYHKTISTLDRSGTGSTVVNSTRKIASIPLSRNIHVSKPPAAAPVLRSNPVRTSSLSETKRRDFEKVLPRKRPSPRRSPPRRRRSSSHSSKRRRRESHSPPRHHRPSESSYRRRPSPLPIKRISPPRRRIVPEYSSRDDDRKQERSRYESSSRRERERSRSRSRDVHRRPKNDGGDYRRERRYDERRHEPTSYDSGLMVAEMNKANEPVVVLSNDHLTKFTALLRTVGVDLGRQISMGDLDGLRERLGSLIFDECLSLILNQSIPPLLQQQQQQHPTPLFPDMFDVQQQLVQQYDDGHRRGGVRQSPPPSHRPSHEGQEYYRHRSPPRKQNRDVVGSSRTTNRNRSPPPPPTPQRNIQPTHSDLSHHFAQLNPMPTPTSLVSYYNNVRNPQVPTNMSEAQQQQHAAMQSIVSNFLSSPSALFQLGQQQPTYIDAGLPYGNETAPPNLWTSHTNAQGRW